MGKVRPSLGMSDPTCLRDLMVGLAVYILTVKVKGQFLHQDLYRDGVTCLTHRHIWHQCPQRSSPRGYSPKPVPRPQVNFCRNKQKGDQPKHSNDGARVTRARFTGAATCSNCKCGVPVCSMRVAVNPIQLMQ